MVNCQWLTAMDHGLSTYKTIEIHRLAIEEPAKSKRLTANSYAYIHH